MAIHIDAGDIIMAMTSGDDMRWYLDRDTGAVGPLLDEDDDNEFESRALLRVPSLDTHEAYRIMERFAAASHDSEVRELLEIALAGKGAFRRFKDAVHRWPDVASSWHEFHDESVLAVAKDWLESEGIEAVVDDPPKPEGGHVIQGGHKAKAPRVGLLEMSLLGAAEGKTELIDGRVYRVFVGESKNAAQKVFADIARDMHERAGLGWRKTYIEGKRSVRVDRFEVSIEACTVELAIMVEPGLWSRFVKKQP